jgi:hypothetical protein
MVAIRTNSRPDESLSFEFNLVSEARIRTVRNLEWVEPMANIVRSKMIFSYDHFRADNIRESECKLLLELDNIKIDFLTGGFMFNEEEYERPWSINLVQFCATPSEFILRGSFKPQMQMYYWGGDIVVFECVFGHSVIMDQSWMQKFQYFNWKMPSNVPFDFISIGRDSL